MRSRSVRSVGKALLGTIIIYVASLFAIPLVELGLSQALGNANVLFLFRGPWFPVAIGCGLVMGVLFRRHSPSLFSWWIITLPLLIFFEETYVYYKTKPSNLGFRALWAPAFFGRDCGASECLYEAAVTIPLVVTFAVTVGYLLARLASPARQGADQEM